MCCWKNIEKNLSVFMERCDDSLHVGVTADVAWSRGSNITIIMFIFIIICCVVAIVYSTFIDSTLRLWRIKITF